jgi:hypothetical protein
MERACPSVDGGLPRDRRFEFIGLYGPDEGYSGLRSRRRR